MTLSNATAKLKLGNIFLAATAQAQPFRHLLVAALEYERQVTSIQCLIPDAERGEIEKAIRHHGYDRLYWYAAKEGELLSAKD